MTRLLNARVALQVVAAAADGVYPSAANAVPMKPALTKFTIASSKRTGTTGMVRRKACSIRQFFVWFQNRLAMTFYVCSLKISKTIKFSLSLLFCLPLGSAFAQNTVECQKTYGGGVVCTERRSNGLDALNNFTNVLNTINQEREAKKEKAALQARMLANESRQNEILRLQRLNSETEKARIDALVRSQSFLESQQEADRQAEQKLRTEVSIAVLEGRCEDAKTISLLASRIDMAEQAMRICKPTASTPALKGAKGKNLGGRVAQAPKDAIPVAQPKSISPTPALISIAQPIVVAAPLRSTPDEEAFKLLMAAAALGSNNAQYDVAMMYAEGRGVAQNDGAAVSWYRAAAEQGNFKAQSALGIMYDTGRGVSQSHAAAVIWYSKAADQGYAIAQYNLGVMYGAGLGVAQDDAAAASWYRKAADQGDAIAQYNLGYMYANGRGVAQDYVQAHKWFSLAGAGATDAAARDSATKGRDIVAAKMQPAQIAEAQRLASARRKK